MSQQSEQNETIVFSLKSNLPVALMLAIAVPLIMILSSASSPGGVNAKAILISIIIGLLIFVIFGGLRRKKLVIDDSRLQYGRKSVDLSQLTKVEEYWRGVIGAGLSQSFYLKLTDKNDGRLTIPIGVWKDQNYLLSIIGKFAKTSGAHVDDKAYGLIEKATHGTTII